MTIALTWGLNSKCCDCGIALYDQEIAFEIVGRYIDYIDHKPGEIVLLYCSGCREKIVHNAHTDQGDAILKRKELEREGAKKEIPKLEFPDVTIDDFRTPNGGGTGI